LLCRQFRSFVSQPAYAHVPRTASVIAKAKGKPTVQMDELWSFVDNKGHKQWVWLAMDTDTREIIACHIGDRSRASALALWQSLPPVYRQCAQVYTDYWEAYETVIPSQVSLCSRQREWSDELH
jgi:insertion element IS1 protein InsB